MPDRTTPRTWSNNEFVRSSWLNTDLIDASLFLKNRPFGNTVMSAIINTTSTSFVELVESRVILTCTGGNMLLAACGISSNSTAGGITTYDIALDGTRYGDATVGLTQITSHTTIAGGYADCFSLAYFTNTPPSAGSHTFSIYWKVSAGTTSVLTRFFALEIR